VSADARQSGGLRVGVDALNLLHDRRGIGRYARAVLHAWLTDERHRVDVTLLVPQLFPGLIARRLAAECGVPSVKVRRRSRARHLDLDVVWHPWNGIFFESGCRDVAVIHDVWPFVHAAGRTTPAAQRRQEPFRVAARRATRILTDSQFSRTEIERHLGVDESRIDVVPLGVDKSLLSLRAAPARIDGVPRYVLFVGETEGRKDLATLIRAMAHLTAEVRGHTALVIAGRRASSATIPSGVHVEFAGEVDDDRLASFYCGAAAFVFPSRYEGFGLPVLEAMAFGVPVIASDAASIPEAAGDAAEYFPAGDAEACARAIERVLGDPGLAASMRTRGRARATNMSWERCADATLAALHRAAEL